MKRHWIIYDIMLVNFTLEYLIDKIMGGSLLMTRHVFFVVFFTAEHTAIYDNTHTLFLPGILSVRKN